MSQYEISLYIAFGLLGFVALIMFYFAVLNLKWLTNFIANPKILIRCKEWFIQMSTIPEFEEKKVEQIDSAVVSDFYTSETYLNAVKYAQTISTDDLLTIYNQLDYPAFGFPALQVYKRTEGGKWTVMNRNEKNWKEEKEECSGKTMREALIKHYAYCVSMGYLPKPKLK